MAELKYKRVLLKLSGEALAGEKQIGIDPHTVSKICAEIADVVDMGLEVALVIGGGTYAKVIPNIVAFGPIFPGDEVREHKPDEFIKIDELMQNAHILAEALYQLAK